MSEDLIKRSDAIKAVAEVLSLNRFASFKDIKDFGRFAERMLRNVPSADRPQGEAPLEHGYMWTCPKCELEVHSDFDTCPRCGYEREDRPQGEWIRDRYWSRGVGMGEDYGFFYKCSLCEYEVENGYTRCGFNFCPYCGADMRKGAGDE